jgi:S1-C subfamily serine protease
MHEKLANSTFRVICGNSSGSGFSFKDLSIVITNHHVVEPNIASGQQIYVMTESGTTHHAKLLAHSDKSKHDYAILQLLTPLDSGRNVLQSALPVSMMRGTKVLFAGFPHGIADLLVHEAIISGPSNAHAFYVDGSVNGGNSGGPIIEAATGNVIGIVTQRRFVGGQSLQSLGPQVSQLSQQCADVASRGSALITGIDFGAFASMMAKGLQSLSQVLEANANSGIGIGFKIDFVDAECVRLGF